MHRKTLLAALVLASGSLISRADPLISIGEQIPVYLTGAAALRHDDNIFLAPQNEEEDFILILTPGINVGFMGADTRAGLTFSEQFVTYLYNDQLDSNLTSLAGFLTHDRPRSDWALNAAYTELDQNNFSARNITQSIRRTVTDVVTKASWNVTAKTSFGAGSSFNRTEYPNSNNVDSDVWTVPLDWYYAISPKVDLSAGYQYRQNQLERIRNDSEDHFFNVGARGRFTSKLEGQFRVGYTQRAPDRGDSSSLLGLSSSLTYEFSPKSTFGFNVSNDFNSSASGASQRSLQMALTGRFELHPQWSVNTELSWESSEEVGGSRRTDEFLVASLGATYAFSTTTSASFSYLHRTNDSNLTIVNFDNNVISASVSVRF
jgi:polysaccharide biosynthesis protein VpsM